MLLWESSARKAPEYMHTVYSVVSMDMGVRTAATTDDGRG